MSALPVAHEETVRPLARSGQVEIEQARAVAEVQAHMLTARRFPRDEVMCRDRIVSAFTHSGLAGIAKYSYARGGTDIEGPSIHALQAIARHWGNIACGVEEISRTGGQSECRAYAMDLETGFKDEKRFVVRHIRDTKGGGKVLTDERDIYELIANMGSRRKRACLEAVIPTDIVEEAMSQVEVTLAADFEITTEYLDQLQKAFAKFGVTKPMIEAFIQRHIDAMTPGQAARLKKIYASLKDGVGKPEDWFDLTITTAGAPAAEPKAGVEGVKDRVRKSTAKAHTEPPSTPPPTEPAATGAPEPFTDEAKALLAIEKAADDGEAGAVVDRCKGQPFYPAIVNAFNARFRTTL